MTAYKAHNIPQSNTANMVTPRAYVKTISEHSAAIHSSFDLIGSFMRAEWVMFTVCINHQNPAHNRNITAI